MKEAEEEQKEAEEQKEEVSQVASRREIKFNQNSLLAPIKIQWLRIKPGKMQVICELFI